MSLAVQGCILINNVQQTGRNSVSWRRASSLFGGVWVFLVVALIDRRVPLE